VVRTGFAEVLDMRTNVGLVAPRKPKSCDRFEVKEVRLHSHKGLAAFADRGEREHEGPEVEECGKIV
jgi:hypothetical protein